MWNNQYEKMPTLVALGMRVYDMLILLRTSWQTIKDCSYTQSSKLKFRSGYWVFCRKDPRWHCEPKSNNLFCSILGQPSLHHNPIIMASGASLLEIYNLRIYVPNPMLKECGGQGHAHFSPASASTPAQGLRIGVDLVARDHAPGWSARLPVWSEVWRWKLAHFYTNSNGEPSVIPMTVSLGRHVPYFMLSYYISRLSSGPNWQRWRKWRSISRLGSQLSTGMRLRSNWTVRWYTVPQVYPRYMFPQWNHFWGVLLEIVVSLSYGLHPKNLWVTESRGITIPKSCKNSSGSDPTN